MKNKINKKQIGTLIGLILGVGIAYGVYNSRPVGLYPGYPEELRELNRKNIDIKDYTEVQLQMERDWNDVRIRSQDYNKKRLTDFKMIYLYYGIAITILGLILLTKFLFLGSVVIAVGVVFLIARIIYALNQASW